MRWRDRRSFRRPPVEGPTNRANAADSLALRAKERHAREQAEHEARLAARQAKAEASGKKPRGKPPEPPVEGPRPNDQINLTDEESRIMPVAGGGFDQCYNAQAAVAAGSLLVVASAVSQAPNDKQQLEPMLDKIEALADELGKPECLLADTGYFSAANVAACDKAGIEPLIAMGRQAVPFADQQSSGFEPDALACRRSAGCKGTSVPQLEGFVPALAQTSQNRPVETPECRGLDPIGEHAQEQPSRKMGGSNPAQVVSPLEAKLIRVEAGKSRDRSVEGFAR